MPCWPWVLPGERLRGEAAMGNCTSQLPPVLNGLRSRGRMAKGVSSQNVYPRGHCSCPHPHPGSVSLSPRRGPLRKSLLS